MTITTGPTPTDGPVRGLHGRLVVRAERVVGRTRLTEVEAQPPLQVMAAHDVHPRVPDLASLTIVSPSGGVLQGDRLMVDLRLGRGARLTVGTQSSVRVYRTPDGGAVSATTLVVGPRAYLEYLPDPWMPYADSRLTALTRCVVDPTGTLVVCEAVVAGRLARGERFALDRFESVVTVERPVGDPFVRDALRIERSEDPTRVGRFGGSPAVATLLVVSPGVGADLVRAAVGELPGVGVSALPDGAGAWVRALGPDARSVMAVVRSARAAVRTQVLGHPPTDDRRP